ncbi:MAG TPA: PAS sensor protein, partial [Phormidium sp.]
MMVNYYIKPWKMPIKDILQPLLETYKSGIEIGDLELSLYAANGYCHYSYMIGSELSELEQKIDSYIELAKQLKQGQTLYHIQPFHQAVINLTNESENTFSLVGNAYNEYNILPLLKQINHGTAIFYLYFNKLILSYLFEQYTEAVSISVKAEAYLRNVSGSLLVAHFYFYDSLAYLAVYPTAAKAGQVIYLKKVLTNQRKMKKWANYAPINHLHKFYLVEAEKYRVLGKDVLAMDYYDRAIALAKENEYIHEAALAYELAAKFYLSKGKELTARSYMQEARYCYQLWGAIAKVKDLEKRYSQLLGINQPGLKDTKTTTIITGKGSGLNLDIATVMKASQAISGEILLDKLLSNLMNILIENAGAQKGYLILENQGKLLIEAEG